MIVSQTRDNTIIEGNVTSSLMSAIEQYPKTMRGRGWFDILNENRLIIPTPVQSKYKYAFPDLVDFNTFRTSIADLHFCKVPIASLKARFCKSPPIIPIAIPNDNIVKGNGCIWLKAQHATDK